MSILRPLVFFFGICAVLFFFAACENAQDEWQQKVLSYAQSDQRISPEEYNELVGYIEAHKTERPFQNLFQQGQLDHAKLRERLVKICAKNGLNNVAINEAQAQKTTPASTFTVQVYVENSASMDGYVKGKTDFETAIYSLLADMKISDFCEGMQLNYINKSVHRVTPDVENFIKHLEPASFRARGGNRSSSDLGETIKKVVQSVDAKNMAVLVSDFVFSPGGGVNASDYLNEQMISIKMTFAQALKNKNLSVAILRLSSQFNGSYYDLHNKPHAYSGHRPYYIWIIATQAQMRTLLNTHILDHIRGGVQEKFVFMRTERPDMLHYKVVRSGKIGEFKLSDKSTHITEAGYDDGRKKGTFGFCFYVSLSEKNKQWQSPSFYLDKQNYHCNKNYDITSIELIEDNNSPSTQGFTHMFKVQTQQLKKEHFLMAIVGKTPAWVSEVASEDDSHITPSSKEAKKTFGLQYLIDGVSEAFYPSGKDNLIGVVEIPIEIK